MTPVEVGSLSVLAIVFLVYVGVYIPVALGLVSFVSIWLISGKSILAFNFLRVAVGDGVTEYPFATIPLFTVMGLLVSRAGLGTDIYTVLNRGFRKLTGGVGMATVGANAVFAAVTGSSIASASVFTRIAVPEMRKLNYDKRFAVGVVAVLVAVVLVVAYHLFVCLRAVSWRYVSRRHCARSYFNCRLYLLDIHIRIFASQLYW